MRNIECNRRDFLGQLGVVSFGLVFSGEGILIEGMPSKPKVNFWVKYKRYYDGEQFRFPDIPDDVWRNAVLASSKLCGGDYDENRHDARLLVALAFGEDFHWVGPQTDEGMGLGRYSIVKKTWDEYGGPELINGRDGRYDNYWSAVVAARIADRIGIFESKSKSEYVNNFTDPPCWSTDESLAAFSWDVWQGLIG